MANYNLTGQKIKNTYGQLAQVNDSNKLVDGLGNEKQIVTSSIVNFDTEVSRSAAEAGFGAGSGGVSEAVFTAYTSSNDSKVDSLTAATSSYLTSLPSGVVSGSSQLPQIGINQTNITSLTAETSSYAVKTSDNTFSGTQTFNNVTLTGITSQIKANNITGSWGQTNGTYELMINGEVSASSYYGDGSNLTNITSASHAVTSDTASYLVGGIPSAGLVSGTGTYSVRSSDSLTTGSVASAPNSIAIGNYANAQKTGSVAIGYGAYAWVGNYTVAIGQNAIANGANSTAYGYDTNASGDNSVAIGSRNDANGSNGVAIGDGATANATNTQAIGVASFANGNEACAVGTAANATGADSVMIGTRGQASANSTVAIGGYSTATSTGATALGHGADATANNAVAIGYNVTANTADYTTTKYLQLLNVSSSMGTYGYVDDAAAATAGVPLGGIYHTSGSLKIRMA